MSWCGSLLNYSWCRDKSHFFETQGSKKEITIPDYLNHSLMQFIHSICVYVVYNSIAEDPVNVKLRPKSLLKVTFDFGF